MPGLLDHIAFLSQEVGPRPAGTEEEQQAALYITEQMQKEAGLSAVIEDFNSESNEEIPRAVCALITIAFTVVALFLPVMEIPALVATAAAALVFVLESMHRPIISKMLASGVSQNVVTKYEPGYSPETGGSRRRKIVVVANYDSGKVRLELKPFLLSILPIVQKVVLAAMVFVPLFLLLRYLFFLHADEMLAVILNVITVVALVLVSIPLMLALIHKFSPYNEAANCNASGTAVLLELARRVGREQVSASRSLFAKNGSGKIYGAEAARNAGLVPEGAQLVYEAAQMKMPEPIPQTEEERLVSAKAAIAALTGNPVAHKKHSSIADSLVRVRENFAGTSREQDLIEQQTEPHENFAKLSPDVLQSAAWDNDMVQNNNAFFGEAGNVVPDEQFGDEQIEQASSLGLVSSTVQGHKGHATQTAQAMEAGASFDAAQAAAMEDSSQTISAAMPISTPDPTVPDWFRKAQENAKRPKNARPNIKRSQYADALDAAVAESSSHFKRANSAVNAETEERLRKMREGIMEVGAPQFVRENLEAARLQGGSSAVGITEKQEAWPQQTTQKEAGELPAREVQVAQVAVNAVKDSTIAMSPINVDELRNEAQAISLPDILTNTGSLPSLAGANKQQRAPLAVAEQSSQTAAKSLLNMLPSIDLENTAIEKTEIDERSDETVKSSRPNLATLPSLSGAIKGKEQASPQEAQANSQGGNIGNISAAGSFAPAGATSAFAPVGNELLENVHPDEIYVDDVDDSAYDNHLTETGAFAGPGYVDMPKSRARKFFDRFRRDKDEDEVSAQEWLDVDEDFEARKIGADRGGWESFKEDSGFDHEASYEEGYSNHEEATEEPRHSRRLKDGSWEGGAFSRSRASGDLDDFSSIEDDFLDFETPRDKRTNELQQIHNFRSSGLDTEVWFVALGSEFANNGGIRAFLAEHEPDLRGAVIINLSALGSGELSYLEREGSGKAGASSRMKRYVTKASQATGLRVSSAAVTWKESAATIMAKRGFQAMSIVGMKGLKPARYAQGDDILENIEEETLQANTNFVMELIKSI